MSTVMIVGRPENDTFCEAMGRGYEAAHLRQRGRAHCHHGGHAGFRLSIRIRRALLKLYNPMLHSLLGMVITCKQQSANASSRMAMNLAARPHADVRRESHEAGIICNMRTMILAGRCFVILLVTTLLVASGRAQTMSPSEQRGQRFAITNCARCHSIDKVSASPLKVAPPFRTLHQKYPVDTLEEALGEGIVTGHPTMPEFRLDPGQVADLIAFLKRLER
jgi:mono/diheme cytochrome c family protein